MSEPDRETASDIRDSLNAPPTKSIHDYRYQVAYIIEDVARMPSWGAAKRVFLDLTEELRGILQNPDLTVEYRAVMMDVASTLEDEHSKFDKIRRKSGERIDELKHYPLVRFGPGIEKRQDDRRIIWLKSEESLFAVMEASHALGYLKLDSLWRYPENTLFRIHDDADAWPITHNPPDHYKVTWLKHEKELAGWREALGKHSLIQLPSRQESKIFRTHFRGLEGPISTNALRDHLGIDPQSQKKRRMTDTYKYMGKLLRHIDELEAIAVSLLQEVASSENAEPHDDFRRLYKESILRILLRRKSPK